MANLIIKNNNSADVSLIFDRGTNANWKLLSSQGDLFIQSDYTTSKGNYYNVLSLNYNSGNVIAKGTITASSFIGNASSATKLTTDAGSATRPVYFYGGVPVVCNTTLGVSITGNATTATKATQDASGNVITTTYETKSDATAKLMAAKSYTNTQISSLSLITVDDIDNICNQALTAVSIYNDGVKF